MIKVYKSMGDDWVYVKDFYDEEEIVKFFYKRVNKKVMYKAELEDGTILLGRIDGYNIPSAIAIMVGARLTLGAIGQYVLLNKYKKTKTIIERFDGNTESEFTEMSDSNKYKKIMRHRVS